MPLKIRIIPTDIQKKVEQVPKILCDVVQPRHKYPDHEKKS